MADLLMRSAGNATVPTPAADRAFWPPLGAIYDFTLRFEETVFNLIPSSIVLAYCPVVISKYWKRPAQVHTSSLLWAKLAVVAILISLEIACLVLRLVAIDFRTGTTIPAASVDLVGAAALGAIVFLEHRHALRGSAFLGAYLLFAMIIDAIRSRSFYARHGMETLGLLAAFSAVARLCLLGLEEMPKTKWFIGQEQRETLSGEATSGYWSRSLFLHLNPMFATGFRTALGLQDLTELSAEYTSKTLYPKIKQAWYGSKLKRKHALIFTLLKSFKGMFLLILIPRLVETAFSYAQPFILLQVMRLVGKEPRETLQERIVLVFATFVTFIGLAMSRTASAHLKNAMVTCARGALVSLLLDKNLDLPQSEANKGAVLTLLSADIEGIAAGLPVVVELVVTLFESGLGIYLLQGFVGSAAYFILVPLTLSTVATYFCGIWTSICLKAWNERIEDRVSKTSSVVAQATAIKMFGLGRVIEKYLIGLRTKEIDASKKFRNVRATSNVPPLCADLVTPVVVIAAALFLKTFSGGGKMTATIVFPSLSIIILIKDPLAHLLNTYPHMVVMLACVRRIEKYLLLPNRVDPRIITGDTAAHSSTTGASSHADRRIVAKCKTAKIAPQGIKTHILQDVNFTIESGSITGVTGPNGAGKSLLLQSLLGETELLEGSVTVESQYIAYCAETPCLRNASIKDNIVGYSVYDEALFNRVLRCCLLDEDIRRLPGGVDYIVGSGGIRLSGGQRQRVALARTLFARMAFVLLDNVFRSLDRRTATAILARLCGQDGFFKQHGTTVLLVTYMPELIDVADQLLVLDGSGNLTVDRNVRKNRSHALYAQAAAPQADTPSESDEANDQQFLRRVQLRADAPAYATNASRQRQSHLYKLFFRPMGYLRSTLWSLAMFLVSAGEIAPEIYMRLWIDRDPSDNLYFIGYAGIGVLTTILFAFISAAQGNYLTPRAAGGVHEQLVYTVIRGTLSFLASTDKGVIMNRFSQDMTLIIRSLPVSFMRTVYVFWTVLIQAGVIASIGSYMILCIPLIAIIISLVLFVYLRTSRQMRALDLECKSPLLAHFEETASGLLHLRAFGWNGANLNSGLALMDDTQKAFYYMACVQQWLGLVIGLLIAGLGALLVALALFVRQQDTSQTALGLSFVSLLLYGNTLEMFIHAWTGLEISIGALGRLQHLIETTPQEATTEITLPEHWPSQGKIELQDVTARYSNYENEDVVLTDVSFSVTPGQKVGVIGRTGSGKTSLFLSLLGFLKYRGVMKIDGIDVSSVPPNELRSRIVTISQDQLRLDANVRVNLLPFTLNDPEEQKKETAEGIELTASRDAELEELLSKLGLWSQLSGKGGLSAMLKDVGYSYGEMQLFSIARAILRYRDTGSRLVLMDEATGAVEQEREKTALQLVAESLPECTILVIGHSRSSLRGVNSTVELVQGRVGHINPNPPSADDGEA